MKLSEVGNGMLFPPSWYGSPPDVPEPDEVDLWPWEDEREGEPVSDEIDLQTVLPIIKGWEIVEQALTELGVSGSHDPMFRSRAEQGAKAIVARLAHHDPPILLCFADEVKDTTAPAPDATVLLQRAYTTLQALKRAGCDWDVWHAAEAEWTVEALGEFLWPDGSGPVE